jgi:hypothetical protein
MATTTTTSATTTTTTNMTAPKRMLSLRLQFPSCQVLKANIKGCKDILPNVNLPNDKCLKIFLTQEASLLNIYVRLKQHNKV